MQVLYDDRLRVEYRFVSLGDMTGEFDLARGHLCGDEHPGTFSFTTSLHTGPVALRIEWHPTSPPLSDAWEDVAEASFEAPEELWLRAFEVWEQLPAPARGWHRARLHAAGMDAAREAEHLPHDATPIDRYLVQLWPEGEARPYELLRATSAEATRTTETATV